LDRFHWLTVK